ncbi:ATP-binding protein [Undibacterium oligocarboniphilum]|uniref:histidine kinase n=1 Tax=Undibacterium oligocarboniphilum TaxID=666702 RepID=A0A850Q8Y4_9BURK|nr:ATP-binding protein [Undibacterium oligocarboniphilum]MBC3868761.1 HAMP domain-containing protein [Undibacterium oligocarboniphilum]NVO76742.1 HAMP domain-containing protein [Undibacterium oligocarboniphilum]
MRSYLNSLEWLRSGLFWRTFFLLAMLVMSSMTIWFISFRTLERTPRAEQLTSQIVSIANITRAALTHAAPEKRKELLLEFAHNQGIRIYTLKDSDVVEALDSSAFLAEFSDLLKSRLGKETRFARNVNGIEAFWISIDIEGDAYWLQLDEDKLDPPSTLPVISWITSTLLITLLGAAAISKFINEPLSRLSNAARLLAQGKEPPALPERGPKEIRETNASFNQMVEDLARIDTDRTIILAGISHDLRTPLARMQLEVELANLDESAREGMQSDLSQMDAIINQFLDYAKPIESLRFDPINVSELLQQVIHEYARVNYLHIRTSIAPEQYVAGNATELRRLFSNLIENACRYGKNPDKLNTVVEIQCSHKNRGKKQGVLISFRDYGDGAPSDDLNRLLKPFTRADASRSQANGSGLGLAIVDRIIRRHRGRLRIYNHERKGFVAVMIFPEMKTK